MNIIAVIPAKRESSRLIGKNTQKIGDRTLTEIAIEYAKSSNLVNKVIVSTDSPEIKQLVDSNNLCDCIMRGPHLSGEADVTEVYYDAWIFDGKVADYVVGIQPDHPDRNLVLDDAINYALDKGFDDLITVGTDGQKNGSIRILKCPFDSLRHVGSLGDDCTNIHNQHDLNKAVAKMTVDPNPLQLEGNHVFVIAEAACNHMCSLELAKAMIDCAAHAGADAIKFQTYKGERIVTKYAPAFWGDETMKQTEYYKRLDKFNKEDYAYLFEYAKEKGIIPFSTPFSIEDATILNELDMEIFKIPSFEIVNLDLLKHIASFNKPIILSTGASTYEEIDRAINIIISQGNGKLALMACTLSYPTSDEDANLLRIQTLKERYPNFLIGMSDHTEPDLHMAIPAISVALGARMIEKHYTMSRTMTGSGHFFSLEPDDLTKMVHNIRLFEKVLGNGEFGTTDCEQRAKDGGRKSIVAGRDIKKGEIITKDMLSYKRPGTGMCPSRASEIIGKKAIKPIMFDIALQPEDIQ